MVDFVIAWLNVKPGLRDEYIAASQSFIATTRAEPGVQFFEFHRNDEDPDGVIVLQGYVSEEAHRQHVASAHLAVYWKVFGRYVIEGRFENMSAETTRTDMLRPG